MMIDVRWKLRTEIESNRSEIVSCSTKKDYCVGYEFSYEKRGRQPRIYISGCYNCHTCTVSTKSVVKYKKQHMSSFYVLPACLDYAYSTKVSSSNRRQMMAKGALKLSYNVLGIVNVQLCTDLCRCTFHDCIVLLVLLKLVLSVL